jgi:hypothetical protein
MNPNDDIGARLNAVSKRFRANVDSVRELLVFDRVVLDYAIVRVEQLHERLVEYGLESPRMNGEHVVQDLRSVSENDSLRPKYKQMFNQCVVLLVSYLGSALADVFRTALPTALEHVDPKTLRVELKVSLRELSTLDPQADLASLLIDRRGLSFQDMKSTVEAFRTYVGVEVGGDCRTNNIVTGQACRHVIVHTGSVADERLLRQLKNASPRTLKKEIRRGETIQFAPDEVEELAEAMVGFVDAMVAEVEQVLGAVPGTPL